MDYYFDDWSDANVLKEYLTKEEYELLSDILTNSSLIDNRPEDFKWDYGKDYGCDTVYDCYYEGYFKLETIEKYKDFEKKIIQILFVQEGFEDISYAIECTQSIYDDLCNVIKE